LYQVSKREVERMIEFTEGSRMRTNASGSPKTEKPNIIPKGQMTNQHTKITSTYPIDDEIVTINGVKYQRIVEND